MRTSLPPTDLGETPTDSDEVRVRARKTAASPIGRFGYLAFGLALLPLAFSLFKTTDLRTQLTRTVEAHPEIAPLFDRESLTMDELLNAVPGGRLDGAHLAHDTFTHWIYALLAALGFFGIIFVLFDRGHARWKHLPLVGLFTSTAGIIFLLVVQQIAQFTEGVWMRGSGIVTLLFYVLKFIGFSYRSALDADTGFFLSFLGFTCGVGLCEEATKAIPLLWHYRTRPKLDFSGACIWGLASGVGFGVAEGIMYSADFYNGVQSADVYVMRFVSCVALHAIWSATVAMAIHDRQNEFRAERHFLEHCVTLVRVAAVPVVLHGLYDTLLKKEMTALALLVAIASFVYLVIVVEKRRGRAEERSAISDQRSAFG
jgi:RsiW-degrading membrane proteinase PrsW (M82 family)